ncbi:hypothetical protein BGX24_003246 [Mortierella sp. AD032]|nr:hypothetical protein BGX24_003246 [Mortierella sp. AD032]
MADRLSNTTNVYIGGAKQTIDETVHNGNLAASDAGQKASNAKTHAEGIGHKIQGQVQQTAASAVGNVSMELSGECNIALSLRTNINNRDT